jgi:recombinational DNA repair protein RecR
MLELYNQAIRLIQEWPGLGPLASQRILEFFLQDATKRKNSLQQLDKLISRFNQCSLCFVYAQDIDKECANCSYSNTRPLMIITSPLDYFACHQHKFFRDYRFFCLNGYVSPHQGKTIKSTHLNVLLELLQKNTEQSVCFLFNQSLESRGTIWLLKKNINPRHKIYDASALLGDKEFLYSLSSQEREHYIISLNEFMTAS